MTEGTQLLQYGALGICLLLAIGAVIKLYADLERERAARLTDAKRFADLIAASTTAQHEGTIARDEETRVLTRLIENVAALSGQIAMLKRE